MEMKSYLEIAGGPQLAAGTAEGSLTPPFGTSFQDFSDPSNRPPDTLVKMQYANYQALVERAVDVFGSELKASRWLSLPSVDLGGKIPLQVAQSVSYAADELERIFEPIFVHMEHGIF